MSNVFELSKEQDLLLKIAQRVPTAYAQEPTIHEPANIQMPSVERELATISAASLVQTEYRPLMQAVHGLIVEGLTLLVGASKIGKSWLVLDMCLSVAAGTDFLSRQTEAGEVLYMALEDSERRLKSRMQQLSRNVAPENLYLCTDALTLGCGIEEQLENWLKKHPGTKLIVIDTLQMIRGNSSRIVNAYQADYDTMRKLKPIADKYRICIILIHHTNKLRVVTDNFDKISGSTGLMGAADTTILMDRQRDSKRATVQVVGRDVSCDDLLIDFDNGHWCIVSENAQEFSAELEYINNPITRILRHLMTQNPDGGRWSYDELRSIGMRVLGYAPFAEAREFTKKLQEIEAQLLAQDNVICTPSVWVGKKRGVLIEFRKPQKSFQDVEMP